MCSSSEGLEWRALLSFAVTSNSECPAPPNDFPVRSMALASHRVPCWKTSLACSLSQRRVESLRTFFASTPCCFRARRRFAVGLLAVPVMCSPVPSRRFVLCLPWTEAQPTIAVALKGFRQAPSLVSIDLMVGWYERHHLMRRHGFPDVM